MVKEESEFGKGLTYCLGLFIAHERDSSIWQRRTETITNSDCERWFNASSDHFYELEIPKRFPQELKDRLTKLRTNCLNWGHGFTGTATYQDVTEALTEAKELLRLIDKFHRIKTIEASWK